MGVAQGERVTSPEANQRPAPRPTILVVDDERVVRGLLMRILALHGYRVLGAASGAEAIAAAAGEGAVDLLLTDVEVPDMSGSALAERLLATRPGLPVLYLSGGDEAGGAPAASGRGVGLLAKPFTAEVLASRVREMLADPATPGANE
jgi:CheY-like chemotaxis protein